MFNLMMIQCSISHFVKLSSWKIVLEGLNLFEQQGFLSGEKLSGQDLGAFED